MFSKTFFRFVKTQDFARVNPFLDDKSLGLVITPYHTILSFNNPVEEGFSKTLWEKEKMLVTSVFYFSHNVFYPIKGKSLHLRL